MDYFTYDNITSGIVYFIMGSSLLMFLKEEYEKWYDFKEKKRQEKVLLDKKKNNQNNSINNNLINKNCKYCHGRGKGIFCCGCHYEATLTWDKKYLDFIEDCLVCGTSKYEIEQFKYGKCVECNGSGIVK